MLPSHGSEGNPLALDGQLTFVQPICQPLAATLEQYG